MSDYEEAVRAVVEREKDVLGDDAITRAEDIQGIKMDETGEVAGLTGDGKEVLQKLVRSYEEIAGDLAGWLIARELKQNGFGDLDLPEEIESKM